MTVIQQIAIKIDRLVSRYDSPLLGMAGLLLNHSGCGHSDEHCCLNGATLLGLPAAEYYHGICSLADRLALIPAQLDSESDV